MKEETVEIEITRGELDLLISTLTKSVESGGDWFTIERVLRFRAKLVDLWNGRFSYTPPEITEKMPEPKDLDF